jgi:tetratricopeptide (TPR) repeat protein
MAVEGRAVRVFISSTFRDLHAEREFLVKHVFPGLRKLCESRGVAWAEIDLRWGITDEQKAEGRVLPHCLAEIDRSRPFFIGILGQRYGWVPEELPAALVEREPWLAEFRGRSITELEMLHAVLRNPQKVPHAFFYFRSTDHAGEGGDAEPPERRHLLADLKERILRSGLPVQVGFRTPQELGAQVRRDFETLLDRLFPEADMPDPLDKEAAEHEAFARSRTGVYVGRPEYLEQLRAHTEGDGPPLVVVGESGGGKSALLARWGLECQRTVAPPAPLGDALLEAALGCMLTLAGAAGGGILGWVLGARWLGWPTGVAGALLGMLLGLGLGVFLWAVLARWQSPPSPSGLRLVVMHFAGASRYSGDLSTMLRRLLGELRRYFGLTAEIPTQPDQLQAAFADALCAAAQRGRLLLILDGLDRLDDRGTATRLGWLPSIVPTNVRLLVSTAPGPILDELKRRGWPTLSLAPLEVAERRELVRQQLEQTGRGLDPQRLQRLVEAPACANPLFLRTVLDELRLDALHETLDERLHDYLAAAEPRGLFESVLTRWQRDYEQDRPGLVGETLALIWAARRGLTEAELRDLLGTAGAPLPRGYFTPLYLAAEGALALHGGRIGFGHAQLRDAAEGRFLKSADERRAAHRRLANYFRQRYQAGDTAEGSVGQALLAELRRHEQPCPTAGARAEAAERLLAALEEREQGVRQPPDPVVRRLVEQSARHFRVGARIVQELPWQLAQAEDWQGLQALLADPCFCANAWGLDRAGVLGWWVQLGDRCGASPLATYQPVLDNPAPAVEYLLGLSALLQATGHPAAALRLVEFLVGHYRGQNELDCLAFCLRQQARLLTQLGDLAGAEACETESATLSRQLGYARPADDLVQGDIQRLRGNLQESLQLCEHEARSARQRGDRAALQAALGNQSLSLRELGDLPGALRCLQEQEQLCRALDDLTSLQTCLGNQAAVRRMSGDLDGAEKLLAEKESICGQLGDRRSLAVAWGEQALIRKARGDAAAALELLGKEATVYRELGDRDGLRRNLGNQVGMLLDRGDLAGAQPLIEEEARLARELNNPIALAKSLANRASACQTRGDFEQALALLKQQEQLCREANHPMGLALALANRAAVQCAMGEPPVESLRLAEEAQRLAQRHHLADLASKTGELVRRLRTLIGASA